MNDLNDSVSDANLSQQYDALTKSGGFVQLLERCFVCLTGEDRKTFLHNFCTNEIKKLGDGEVREAFVLNTKGKLLGFVHVIATADQLLLTGHGDQSQTLIDHLDKYLIREDVEMTDRTPELGSIFVSGAKAAERLTELCGELPELNRAVETKIDSCNIKLVHTEIAGIGFLIVCDVLGIESLKTRLVNCGITNCSLDALDIVRVESQTPWFGIDADETNLPQELQRDVKAISFDKGCYLGQETVARIDARGRVNQLLVGFKSEGDQEPSLGELVQNEKPAGRITSIARLPGSGDWIGLGYVRRQFKDAGTQLEKWIVR